MYYCAECGTGTPDTHKPTCSESPEGRRKAQDDAAMAVISNKLQEANASLLWAAGTLEGLGMNEQAQTIRDARWKLADAGLVK